jgi:aspartyl-tRNA(Asn)/glutamyl-tRNA(Gln) amidotransferase subunit A
MIEAFERALGVLTAAGAEVSDEPDELFDLETILRDHRIIMAAEAATVHEGQFAEQRGEYAPRIAQLVEEGLAIPATRYRRCQDDRNSKRADVEVMSPPYEPGEALVMPATIGPAPDRSTTGDPALNSPWSYLGWPAASFPIGLSPDGLPLALQLVGEYPFDVNPFLETVSWCEDVIRRAFHANVNARSD